MSRLPLISRVVIAVVSTALVLAGTAALAGPPSLPAPGGITAAVSGRVVRVTWTAYAFPNGVKNQSLELFRDGSSVAKLAAAATSYNDGSISTGGSHAYYLVARGTLGARPLVSPPSQTAAVTLPGYLVGAATADITPAGTINQGGNGLGDGSVIPQQLIGRGSQNSAQGEQIQARALVISDGTNSIAIADIETQGYFAAYQEGPWGLDDMAAQVQADLGDALPASNILIASDHTHSGPDTIGVWGGMRDVAVPGYDGPNAYFKWVKDQTVAAIENAYRDRRFASIVVGRSDASDLIYNQSCSEALNQGKETTYPGPELCGTPGKDGMVRVLQARDPSGDVVTTYMSFAAHATAGGGPGVHGDWPQFLSDALSSGYSRTIDGVTYESYGGIGIAMEGANGGTQPCRPACAFTSPDNPGYDIGNRREAYTVNYMAHVKAALEDAREVTGPVAAAKDFIREPVTGPAVAALFMGGKYMGAEILRSHEPPWANGNTIRTVVSALRVGDVLFAGTPGEGFYSIGKGIRDNVGAREVFQLGLANDQLGYLIAPATYVPVIAAEAAVNDNIIFNVSPTVGDHVMCSDIRLALSLGFEGSSPASCANYDAQDGAGDPIGDVPLGGPVLP